MSTGAIAVRYGARCAKCAIGLDCSGREGSTHAQCTNVLLAQSGWWTMPQGTVFACASCRCHCCSHVLDYCHHCGHHGNTCCCHFSSVKATATATTHHRTPTLRPHRSTSAPQHVRPETRPPRSPSARQHVRPAAHAPRSTFTPQHGNFSHF